MGWPQKHTTESTDRHARPVYDVLWTQPPPADPVVDEPPAEEPTAEPPAPEPAAEREPLVHDDPPVAAASAAGTPTPAPLLAPLLRPISTPTPSVVHLEDVHRHFGTDSVIRALNGVNLQIRRGESMAVIGPSGSGKSTLMNVVGLLDRPTSGRYRLDGIDVEGLTDRERAGVRASKIGFVFQSFHLLAQRTAVENVMLGDAYRAAPRSGRRERAIAVLERVGLNHRIDAFPTKLSGGERQRVAIARALLGEPSLLLCDEPTGNLDSENTQSVLELFEALVGTGLTLIVVTHEHEVANRMARQVHMIDGRLTNGDAPRRTSAWRDPK